MKIYTRTGDNGDTSLLYGGRFSKSETIFEILGTLDELNSVLGLSAPINNLQVKKIIFTLQNDLFYIGAKLADTRDKKNKFKDFIPKVSSLESEIDVLDSKLKPLKNFILPGGSLNSAQLHLARAVCRRLERLLVAYSAGKKQQVVFGPLLKYVNRLSDLLFILARYVNKLQNKKDIIWSTYDKTL